MRDLKPLACLAFCTLVSLVSGAALGAAPEGDARTYAVLSLIGDKINVVGHQATTGGNLDRNHQASIVVNTPALDDTAVQAAVNAIKRLDARATTVGLISSNATLYEMQSELFDRDELSAALGSALRDVVQSRNATHLVLITKHRADSAFRLADSYTGSGKIDGVGFYLDADLTLRQLGEKGGLRSGFLAPFAYVKVSLIDLKTMSVVGAQTADEGVVYSTARAAEGSLRPADVLTPAQKTAALQNMIRRAVAKAMPGALGVKHD